MVKEWSEPMPDRLYPAWIKGKKGWAHLRSNQSRPLSTHTHSHPFSATEQGFRGCGFRGLIHSRPLLGVWAVVEKWSNDGLRLLVILACLAALVLLLAPLPGATG